MHSILLFIQSVIASLFAPPLSQVNWQAILTAAKPALRMTAATILILSLISITGCSGCQSQEEKDKQAAKEKLEKEKKEKEKKKKKKRKPDFESMAPIVLPGIVNDPIKMQRKATLVRNDPIQKEIDEMRSRSRRKNYAKPGHWQDVRYQANANHYDCLLYTSPSPRDATLSRMPSSA